MRKNRSAFIGAAAVLMACTSAHAAGAVDVRWIEPETFSDAGRSEADRSRVMQTLDTHINRLARSLPTGQTLTLDVTDLNLAGEIVPASWRDVRVLRGGADWPQMSLRYTLQSEGRTLKSGEVRLSDMHYTFTTRPDELGYEKRMIDRWFKSEFLTP